MADNLRVLYDLSYIGDGRVTGVERFSIEISKNLKSTDNFTIILALPKGADFFSKYDVEITVLPFKSKVLNHLLLCFFALFGKYDKVCFPSFPPSPLFIICKLFRKIKIYRVIHDAVYWTNPDTLSTLAKIYFKPLEFFWSKRYDAIFTVSEHSRRVLNHYLNCSEIVVVHNGISDSFLISGQEKIEAEADITRSRKNLLAVGTIEPRKNYEFLIEVFSELIKDSLDWKLTICGRAGWGYQNLINKIDSLDLTGFIKVETGLSDLELANKYKSSDIFLMTSKEEGFGIPIIEAMSFGLPIIAANNSAISEIVSDYGLLLDEYLTDVWVNKIVELERDSEQYASFVEKSKCRSAHFSWERSAKIIQGVLVEK